MQWKMKPWTLEPVVLLIILEFPQSVKGYVSHDQVIERNIVKKIRKEVNNAVTIVEIWVYDGIWQQWITW